ncbi:hypothetical protein [Georgenia daeguensis]
MTAADSWESTAGVRIAAAVAWTKKRYLDAGRAPLQADAGR